MDQVRKLLKRKLQEHHPDKGHDPSEKVATHADMVHTINELLELLPRNAEADSAEAVESWRQSPAECIKFYDPDDEEMPMKPMWQVVKTLAPQDSSGAWCSRSTVIFQFLPA